MTWRYFGGASILAAGLLIKFGAPVPALLLGIASAAAANWWTQRKHSSEETRSS
jgi:hypothetical protein